MNNYIKPLYTLNVASMREPLVEEVDDVAPGDECFICLRAYNNVEDEDDEAPPCVAVKILTCGHIVGKRCLVKYQRRSNDPHCPLCWQEINFRHIDMKPIDRFFHKLSQCRWYYDKEKWTTDLGLQEYRNLRFRLQDGDPLSTKEALRLIHLQGPVTVANILRCGNYIHRWELICAIIQLFLFAIIAPRHPIWVQLDVAFGMSFALGLVGSLCLAVFLLLPPWTIAFGISAMIILRENGRAKQIY